MSLLNLFFGRRNRSKPVGTSVIAMDKLEALAETASDLGLPDTLDRLLETETPAPKPTPVVAVAEPVSPRPALAIIRGRASTLMLGADAPSEERKAKVLQRLEVVHDPNEVVLTGRDRSARLVIADRRILSARFSLPEGEERVFDFRREAAEVDSAVDCVRALSDLCVAPVDLLISERPFTGIFAGAGGFAVADVSFDEETCRTALAAALEMSGEIGSDFPVAEGPVPEPAFAEVASDFIEQDRDTSAA